MGPREQEFLTLSGIPKTLVFDARGLGRSQYRARMKISGHWLACNTSPCRMAGHRLRTRSGHCVVCKPEALLFQIRYEATMDIYVASSESMGCSKIGISENAELRCSALNHEDYGGLDDWECDWSYRCSKAGRVEFTAISLLEAHHLPLYWSKDGLPATTCEVFDVGVDDAVNAIRVARKMVNG